MSDINEAYKKWRDNWPGGINPAYDAFLAGAAWQREADAKLCREMGKVVSGGYNNACHDIADAILKAQSNQDSKA